MNTQMVRTTVYLEKELVTMAKLHAVKTNTTLTNLVSKGLKDKLNISDKKKKIRVGGLKLGKNYKFERRHAYE